MNKEKFITTISNISIDGTVNSNEWVIINIVEDINITCICGKMNNIYYSLYNKNNGKTVDVGFDCITKYLVELKDDAVLLCKQHTYKKTSKNPKRICYECHKHNIPNDTELWRNICKTCWGTGARPLTCMVLGNKICTQCFTLSISPTSSSKLCSGCYKLNNDITKVDKDNLRSCSICMELKILKSDHEFKDKCSDCYKNSKQSEELEEKRPCSLCNELLIPISKPDYIDKCNLCFKKTVANVEKRACIDCNLLKIPINQPAFKNKCIDCFKLNINNNVNRACSICNQLNITANKPSYINKCTNCYNNSKLNSITDINNISNKSNNIGNIPNICNIPNIGNKKVINDDVLDINIHMGNLNFINTIMKK